MPTGVYKREKWMKTGKYIHTEEQAKKIGMANTGNKAWNKGLKNTQIPWNKGKRCDYLRGENHYNWKGGTNRTERHTAMSRVEYILWRTAVYTRDSYTCQICNQRGGELNADHIKPWASYPELRYAIDNGRTLCVSCHMQTDTWGGKTYVKK